MRAIRAFLYVLRRSFTDPGYYSELLKAPLLFSLKFFFAYFFVYALLGAGILGRSISPGLKQLLNTLPDQVTALYPEELAISIKNGEVTTNVKEPYVIPVGKLSKFVQDESSEDKQAPPANLLVIDTKATVDNFSSYKSFLLLTKRTLIVQDKQASFRVFPLQGIDQLTINKQAIVKPLHELDRIIPVIGPVLITLLFLAMLIGLPSLYLALLVILALCILVIAKLFHRTLPYSKAYQLGMHMILLPTTILDLLAVFSVAVPIPLIRFLAFLLFSLVVVQQLPVDKKR